MRLWWLRWCIHVVRGDGDDGGGYSDGGGCVPLIRSGGSIIRCTRRRVHACVRALSRVRASARARTSVWVRVRVRVRELCSVLIFMLNYI